MTFNGENIKGHKFDPELAKQIQHDASANLHNFLDNIDWDNLSKPVELSSIENNFTEFSNDMGEYIPTGIELNGYFLYESKIDEDSFALRKMGKKIKYVKVYQSLAYHKIDKFIVLPGWDEILYFNTLTHRMSKKNLR